MIPSSSSDKSASTNKAEVLSYIDRANIGNAKIEGIEADLGLSPKQYQITLSIFFIGYILCGTYQCMRSPQER
jgi:hypothetical protein